MSNIEIRWVEHTTPENELKRVLQYRTYNTVQDYSVDNTDQPQYIKSWSEWKSVPIIQSVLEQ